MFSSPLWEIRWEKLKQSAGVIWFYVINFVWIPPRVKYIVPVEMKIFYYNDDEKDKDDCENLAV